MAFTIPFKEIVELTVIFLDSDWFDKLINTLQFVMKIIIYDKEEIKPE
jgi:hypothetical protein